MYQTFGTRYITIGTNSFAIQFLFKNFGLMNDDNSRLVILNNYFNSISSISFFVILDMLASLKSVPFTNWDEWMNIKNGLYSQEITDKQKYVNIVSMWRTKGNLPHSIDLTASIIEIQLKDNSFNSKNKFDLETDSLRLLYSIIIVRAVNGLVDPSQQGYFAQSILGIAERMGLPGWIVELRHDATHKELSSLSVLRAASQYMLQWYYDNYWEPQYNSIISLSNICVPPSLINCDNELSHEIWQENLLKKCDASFLTEIFVPFFVSLIFNLKNPFTKSNHISLEGISQYVNLQFQSQLESWQSTPIQLIQKYHEQIIHPLLCKLLSSSVEIIITTLSDISLWDISIIKIHMISKWFEYLLEQYINKPLISPVLAKYRTKFADIFINQLRSFESNEFILNDSFFLSGLNSLLKLSQDYQMLSPERKGLVPSSSVNESKDIIETQELASLENWLSSVKSTNKKRKLDVIKSDIPQEKPNLDIKNFEYLLPNEIKIIKATKCLNLRYEQLTDILSTDSKKLIKCIDFPLWPSGLIPGNYENTTLFKLNDVTTQNEM